MAHKLPDIVQSTTLDKILIQNLSNPNLRTTKFHTQEDFFPSKDLSKSTKQFGTIYNLREKKAQVSLRNSFVDSSLTGNLSTKPPTKQIADLMEQNCALKREILALRKEKGDLLNTFKRLKEEYNDDEKGEKYNERRFILLKSLVEQKDRHIQLLNKYMEEINGILDEDHKLMTKVKQYIKRRNVDYQENERELSRLNMRVKDEYTRRKMVTDCINRFKKVETDFKKVEGDLGISIRAHFRKYENQLKNNLALFVLQKHIKSHLGSVLLCNITKDPTPETEKNEISKEFVSKLESSLNKLLNQLIEAHGQNIERKSGLFIGEIPSVLSLNSAIKESAEDVLNLVLGNSMDPQKIPLKLNPLYTSFVPKKENFKDVIKKAYESTPTNDALIKDIMDLTTEENSVHKHNMLLKKLEKLREKETAHVLARYMSDYENNNLHKILQECVEKLRGLQEKVNNTFEKLENKFKDNTINTIKKIQVMFQEMHIIRDKETKRKEKVKLLDQIKWLKKYVEGSLQVPAIREIKSTVKDDVAELQRQKLLVLQKNEPIEV